MSQDRGAIQYIATITRNKDDLFESMTATVGIPVRRMTIDRKL
jgi:hypothetical protein